MIIIIIFSNYKFILFVVTKTFHQLSTINTTQSNESFSLSPSFSLFSLSLSNFVSLTIYHFLSTSPFFSFSPTLSLFSPPLSHFLSSFFLALTFSFSLFPNDQIKIHERGPGYTYIWSFTVQRLITTFLILSSSCTFPKRKTQNYYCLICLCF